MDTKPTGLVPAAFLDRVQAISSLVSNASNDLQLRIKNTGKTPFAGGKITEINFDLPTGLETLTYSPTTLSNIPALDTNEETDLFYWKSLRPIAGGIGRLTVEIVANNGEEVQLRRTMNDTPKNPLTFYIDVGDLQDLIIIHNLDVIREKVIELVKLSHAANQQRGLQP